MRYLLVVSEPFAQAANRAAAQVDPTGGAETFTVPLADSQGATVAYWCSWDMGATGHDFPSLQGALKAEGATDNERKPVGAGNDPVFPRLSIFPADEWTPDAVLTELGLYRPDPLVGGQ